MSWKLKHKLQSPEILFNLEIHFKQRSLLAIIKVLLCIFYYFLQFHIGSKIANFKESSTSVVHPQYVAFIAEVSGIFLLVVTRWRVVMVITGSPHVVFNYLCTYYLIRFCDCTFFVHSFFALTYDFLTHRLWKNNYTRTSVARILIARLAQLFRTCS